MFSIGIQHPSRNYLGQWEAVISAAINAGVQVYRIRSEEEMAKDALEFKEEQANKAAAREAEALRIQQEAIKAMQQQQAAPTGGAGATGPAASGNKILGMQPGTFYTIAGVTVGAVLLGTILLTKGK
jgi:biotin carboxyl carrier protein